MIEVVPIVQVDEGPVATGQPGPVTAKLQKLYQAAVKDYVKGARKT
jgi:branched-subunit amino acid aminotransferase/4-amino-4-deoxychorismate lyase